MEALGGSLALRNKLAESRRQKKLLQARAKSTHSACEQGQNGPREAEIRANASNTEEKVNGGSPVLASRKKTTPSMGAAVGVADLKVHSLFNTEKIIEKDNMKERALLSHFHQSMASD